MKFIKLDNCPIFSRNIQSHTIVTPRAKNMIIKMYIVLLTVFNLNHIYPYGCTLSKSIVWVGSLHNGKMMFQEYVLVMQYNEIHRIIYRQYVLVVSICSR